MRKQCVTIGCNVNNTHSIYTCFSACVCECVWTMLSLKPLNYTRDSNRISKQGHRENRTPLLRFRLNIWVCVWWFSHIECPLGTTDTPHNTSSRCIADCCHGIWRIQFSNGHQVCQSSDSKLIETKAIWFEINYKQLLESDIPIKQSSATIMTINVVTEDY